MYEHMVNWKLVMSKQAAITPKDKSSVFMYIGTPTDTFKSIKGNRSLEIMYIDEYPMKLIPIYGF